MGCFWLCSEDELTGLVSRLLDLGYTAGGSARCLSWTVDHVTCPAGWELRCRGQKMWYKKPKREKRGHYLTGMQRKEAAVMQNGKMVPIRRVFLPRIAM
jgi:hypothetical protein